MFFENSQLDNQPLARVGGVPVYGTTVFVAALVLGLVVTVVTGLGNAFALFAFLPELFWKQGQVWRVLTYPLVQCIDFFTIFNLLFLYGFGRDCEQEMGRRRYFAFICLLIVTPVVVATLLWLIGFHGGVSGSVHLSMGLVIAFATLYPNVQWWGSIPMKYVGMGCVFLAAVGHLRTGDDIGLGGTLVTCAVAFAYIRGIRMGVFEGFSFPAWSRRGTQVRPDRIRKADTTSDMDELLDKIAKSGMASLSAKERVRLESAREELLRKTPR